MRCGRNALRNDERGPFGLMDEAVKVHESDGQCKVKSGINKGTPCRAIPEGLVQQASL